METDYRTARAVVDDALVDFMAERYPEGVTTAQEWREALAVVFAYVGPDQLFVTWEQDEGR